VADDWVSPDSIEDTGENWHSGTLGNVIDGNSGTFGYCLGLNPPAFWTYAVEMTLNTGIQCDKVRVDAGNWYVEEEEAYNAIVNLDVYWDGAWHDVYDGLIYYHNPGVSIKEIDSGNTHLVTKARANFQYNGNGDEPVDVRFWEFDFNQVTGIARPLVGGSLAAGRKGLV